jgi:hypothetical protein
MTAMLTRQLRLRGLMLKLPALLMVLLVGVGLWLLVATAVRALAA